MRSLLIVCCLILVSSQARAGEVASRAFALHARSLVEGLPAVAASDNLTIRDRQILRIMAQVSEDSLAAAILGPEPVENVAAVRAVRGSPSLNHNGVQLRQAAASWGYTVLFENQTSEDLDEVVIFWQRKMASGLPVRESRAPFPAQSYYSFVLGKCSELQSYVIGVFLYGKRIFKIPSGDDMSITPEIASRYNPNDHDPCSDSWTLRQQ